MNKLLIEIGDLVTISFPNDEIIERGIVHHVPAATGDSWIIEEPKRQKLHYISEPCTVTYDLD